MILIRVDGNARIGMGHLMRCMTIAEELALLQGSKDQIRFVCADEASGVFIRESGFQGYVLGTDYRNMESELPLWRGIRKGPGQEGMISGMNRKGDCACAETVQGADKGIRILVDSYYVTDVYLTALREIAWTILMDDMGVHRYPADCIINYNAPADRAVYQKLYRGSGAGLFIGSSYIPLRRQFRRAGAECPQHLKTDPADGKTDGIRDVLITTGGGDNGDIAEEILNRIYSNDYSFHLVLGRFQSRFQRMKQLEKEHDNIHIHHDVKDMAGLMRRCQAAVTAGGSTIYELAALGIPFVCFSCAENQEALVDYIGSRQIAGSAGAWHKEPEQTLGNIQNLFRELAEAPELREQYRKRETGMVDGEGAGRLARAILGEQA